MPEEGISRHDIVVSTQLYSYWLHNLTDHLTLLWNGADHTFDQVVGCL
jgi:hypothetical protein